MPLCPQITNTPIPYSTWFTANSSNFTVDNTAVVQSNATTYYASSAPNAQAIGDTWFDTSNGNKQYRWDGSSWIAVQDTAIATATSTANTALSTANTAQSTANTAQTTANGKNKVTYSTSAASGSGTTNGDIWFQYTTGGVITAQWTWNGSSWVSNTLNSTVIASLDAGKITAGTISVALTLSAATITGGSIDINSGTFQVSSAGAVNITSGSLNINAGTFQVTSAGALTATSATITGTITTSNLTATGGTIGGITITSTALTGGLIQTSSGSTSVSLDSTYNALRFKNGGSYVGAVVPLSGNGVLIHYGATPNGAGSTYPNILAAASTASIAGSASYAFVSGTSRNDINGDVYANAYLYNPGYISTTGAANMRINTSTGLIAYTSSVRAHKLQIQNQVIPVESILALKPQSYIDKFEAEEKGTTEGLPRYLGLIAEDVDAIPVLKDLLVDRKDGELMGINYDRIAVALIPMLQAHEIRLNKLEGGK